MMMWKSNLGFLEVHQTFLGSAWEPGSSLVSSSSTVIDQTVREFLVTSATKWESEVNILVDIWSPSLPAIKSTASSKLFADMMFKSSPDHVHLQGAMKDYGIWISEFKSAVRWEMIMRTSLGNWRKRSQQKMWNCKKFFINHFLWLNLDIHPNFTSFKI